MHGVGVDVPATWARNDDFCGSPKHDTVIVMPSEYVVGACLSPPGRHLSVVRLGAYDADPAHRFEFVGDAVLGKQGLGRLHRTTVAGEPAYVGTRPPSARVDSRVHVVVFPQRRAFVTARSPDPGVARQVIDSIRLVDRDGATGCREHTRQFDAPDRLPEPDSRALAPAGAQSATACAYVDGWLEQTATVSNGSLRRLTAALDHAPAPTSRHAPHEWPGCVSVQQHTHITREPMALSFRYADGSTRLVVARIAYCTRWQSYVTNGKTTRRLGSEVMRALPPVWTSYPDPGSLRVR